MTLIIVCYPLVTAQSQNEIVAEPRSNLSGILTEIEIIGPVTNDSILFSLYVPPDYDGFEKNIPVAIWLHGLNGNHKGSVNIIRAYEDALKNQLVRPMIIIIPDGYTNTMWADGQSGTKNAETNVIHEILPYVEDHYKVIPDRKSRLVMGFSMGGFGAIEYAVKFPQLFGVAVNFDGALHNWESINNRPTLVDEIFHNDSTYWKQYNPYDNLMINADSVRSMVKFRTYVGRLVEYNERYKRLMEEQNIAYDVIVTSCGHNMKCIMNEVGTDFFTFINTNVLF